MIGDYFDGEYSNAMFGTITHIKLSRKIGNILLVTYLPTILIAGFEIVWMRMSVT